MLTIEKIRQQAAGMKVSFISEQTGLHYHTVRHALKPGTNPSYETVKALSDYLGSRQYHAAESRQ